MTNITTDVQIDDADIMQLETQSGADVQIDRSALAMPADISDVIWGSFKHATLVGGYATEVYDPDLGSRPKYDSRTDSKDRKDIEDAVREQSKGLNIPVDLLGEVASSVDHTGEVNYALRDLQQEIQWTEDVASLGMTGQAIALGVTFMDPAVWATGGVYGLAAKAPQTITKLYSSSKRINTALATGTVGAVEAGAYVAGLDALNYTYDSDDIIYSAIAGGVFAGGLGALGAQSNQVQKKLLSAEDKNFSRKVNSTGKPGKTGKVETDRILLQHDLDGNIDTDRTLSSIDDVYKTDPELLEKNTSKLQSLFNKTNLSLYNQAMKQGNKVLTTVSHRLLSGSLKPVSWTAAEVKDRMRSVILEHNTAEIRSREWIKAGRGRTDTEFFDTLYNVVRGIEEPVDDIMKQAAKEVRLMYSKAREAAAELNVTLPDDPNYLPHSFDGTKIRNLLQLGKYQEVEDFITAMFARGLNDLDPKISRKIAKTIIARTIDTKYGLRTNLDDLMGGAGRTHLKGLLEDMGVDPISREAIMKRLPKGSTKDTTNRTMQSIKKSFDVVLDNSDLKVSDLVSTDIYNIGVRYAEEISGHTALSQIGVRTQSDWNELKTLAMEEATTSGKNPTPVGQSFDDMYNSFLGRPTRGGVNKVARRFTDAAALSLYNNLGWTSAIELSNVAVQAGFKNTLKAIPGMSKFIKQVRTGDLPEDLIQSLKYTTAVDVKPHLVSPRIRLDVDAGGVSSDFGNKIDNVLAKGAEFQGIASGFYTINSVTRHMAINSTIANILDKIGKKGDTDIAFYGITEELRQRIITNLQKYPPKKNTKGTVVDLKTYKWDVDTAMEFEMAVNRGASRGVQKALIGEATPQFGSTLGAIIGQTLSFPITAVNKQLGYNLARGDVKSVMNLMTTTAFAGIMYTAKTYLDSLAKENPAEYRDERLTTNHIMWGAINYSPMLPFAGNIASFFNGVRVLPNEFSPGEGRYTSGRGAIPVLSSIPSVSTAERWMRSPSKIFGADRSVDDRASGFKAIPLMNLPPLRIFVDTIQGMSQE